MTYASIELTQQQKEIMGSNGADWLPMTPAQAEFIRSAQPDEKCLFYGDEILRIPATRLDAIMEQGFKAAASAAFELLAPAEGEDFEFECESPDLGQTFVRVTATTGAGRKATGVGMIPDPRQH